MNERKEVLVTKDYSMFKKLQGNRPVLERRVNKIIASITKVGYITSPIIVNEKFEIIDGQGRLGALEQLKMPVEYIIHPGIGIDECIAMNINQGNWSLKDYIESYSVRGNESYKRLEKLIKDYPLANLDVIATAVLRINKITGTMVKDGSLVISESQYNKAVERLSYAYEILNLVDKTAVRGGIMNLLQVILYCYDYEGIDLKRLKEQIVKNIYLCRPWNNIDTCFNEVEELYNRNISKKIYFYTSYRQEKARRASEIAKEQALNRERINGRDFAKVALKDRKHPFSV